MYRTLSIFYADSVPILETMKMKKESLVGMRVQYGKCSPRVVGKTYKKKNGII